MTTERRRRLTPPATAIIHVSRPRNWHRSSAAYSAEHCNQPRLRRRRRRGPGRPRKGSCIGKVTRASMRSSRIAFGAAIT
jgi:hypothetical protein